MTKPNTGPHVNYFEYLHHNPPPPFNPEADPLAKQRYAQVTASLISDDFYRSHTREECREEWARRYAALASTTSLAPLGDSLAIIRNYDPDAEPSPAAAGPGMR